MPRALFVVQSGPLRYSGADDHAKAEEREHDRTDDVPEDARISDTPYARTKRQRQTDPAETANEGNPRQRVVARPSRAQQIENRQQACCQTAGQRPDQRRSTCSIGPDRSIRVKDLQSATTPRKRDRLSESWCSSRIVRMSDGNREQARHGCDSTDPLGRDCLRSLSWIRGQARPRQECLVDARQAFKYIPSDQISHAINPIEGSEWDPAPRRARRVEKQTPD